MEELFGRENDLALLQVRLEGAGADWKPRHSYNLTSDITFAKAVVDTFLKMFFYTHSQRRCGCECGSRVSSSVPLPNYGSQTERRE